MRKRRTKKEMEEFVSHVWKNFLQLSEQERLSLWNKFYEKSDFTRKLANIVRYLLLANGLSCYFEDVWEEIRFKLFQCYVLRFLEGKYDRDFLERVAYHNARHFAIEEVIKLKRKVEIENFEDEFSTAYDYERLKTEELLRRIRKSIEGKVSQEALELFDVIYLGERSFKREWLYDDYRMALKELKEVLGLRRRFCH